MNETLYMLIVGTNNAHAVSRLQGISTKSVGNGVFLVRGTVDAAESLQGRLAAAGVTTDSIALVPIDRAAIHGAPIPADWRDFLSAVKAA